MMNTARSGFDRTLEAIEAKIIELFGMVTEDLPAVTQAFLDGARRHGDSPGSARAVR